MNPYSCVVRCLVVFVIFVRFSAFVIFVPFSAFVLFVPFSAFVLFVIQKKGGPTRLRGKARLPAPDP